MGYTNTKLGNENTDFDGVEETKFLPGSRIERADIGEATATNVSTGILADQGLLSQMMTGKQLDGSTAWSGSPQRHDGDVGCMLGWPLSTSYFSSGSTSSESGVNFGIHLDLAQIGDGAKYSDRLTILRWPVYCPTGPAAEVPFLVTLYGSENVSAFNLGIARYDTSMVNDGYYVTRDESVLDNKIQQFYISLPGGEVSILSLELNPVGLPTDIDTLDCFIYGIDVMPMTWQRADVQEPASATDMPSDSAGIGLLTAAAFTPIWSNFTTASTYPTLCSRITATAAMNDAFLHESITGQQIQGKASLTATAHTHDGSGSQTIDLPLLSTAYGYVPVAAVGLDTSTTPPEATSGTAPGENSTAYATARLHAVQMPKRTGSPSMNWGLVVYNDDPSACDVRIGRSTDGSSWTNATAVAADASGWQYVSGALTYTSETGYIIRVEIKNDSLASEPVYVTGLVLWDT